MSAPGIAMVDGIVYDDMFAAVVAKRMRRLLRTAACGEVTRA
jgi:hypothetical protein